MSGYIKDYRSELKSDIWLMPPLYHRVWQYLKYKVNHSPNRIPLKDGDFLNIEPGQHLTSIRTIAKGVGYYERALWKEPNPRTISKILDWLESQNMVSIDRGDGNRQYTLITLLNWGLYQSEDGKGNSEYTENTQVSKQSVHINKNDKNDKNDNRVRRKKIYDTDSLYYKMAKYFYDLILRNNPDHRKPNLQNWSDDFRKLVELDKRDKDQVREVMEWVQADDFEHTVVLSPGKFRARYDQLLIKTRREVRRVEQKSSSPSLRLVSDEEAIF